MLLRRVRAERRWRRWRRLVALFCLLVGVSRCEGATEAGVQAVGATAPPQTFIGGKDFVPSILRAFLRLSNTAGTQCSVAVLADHTPTAQAVVQAELADYAGGGATLLQLPASLQVEEKEALDKYLKKLVKMGRTLRRISGCFTVVFVSDSKLMLKAMLEHSTDGRLMVWSTHGVVVTSIPQSSVLPTLEGIWAFTMMNTHLLLLRPKDSGNSAMLFRHEPYSPTGPKTKLIGSYTPQRGLTISSPLHYEKFDNFFGSSINFTTLSFMPYIGVETVTQPDGSKKFEFSGSDYEMLMSFGRILNFTATFVETGDWGLAMEEVTKRNSFIVPSIYYVSGDRLEKIDYVAPYVTNDIAFVMQLPRIVSSWDSFLRPFFTEVWLFTLAVVLVVPVCLILVLKFSTGDHIITVKLRGGAQVRGEVLTISKTRALFEVFGALLGQDFSFKMPNTHSFRMLLAAWFVFIIVLSTGYKSNLISFMTSPRVPTRFETFSELIKQNITVTYYSKALHTMLQLSDSQEYNTIATKQSKFVGDNNIGLAMTKTHGTAHIDNRIYLASSFTEHFTSPDGSNPLYFGRERILSSLVAFPIPHDAPFKQQLDNVMLGVVQGGLYEKMTSIAMEKMRIAEVAKNAKKKGDDGATEAAANSGPVKPLTVDNTQGPFWIQLCGGSMAIIAFILELIYYRLTKKYRKEY